MFFVAQVLTKITYIFIGFSVTKLFVHEYSIFLLTIQKDLLTKQTTE